MATRTFLTSEQIQEALDLLKKEDSRKASSYIASCLEKKLSAHSLWKEVRPIKLGSWSRDELCAKSDIDLLFLGEESKVKKLVDDFYQEGLKIRYRVPVDMNNWTKGVEAFDVIALLNAKAFYAEDESAIEAQKILINKRGKPYKRELFKAMMVERKERAKRYDSIANFLEPNLKYGSGGLRDLEQGLTIVSLFFFDNMYEQSSVKKMFVIKDYLLKIRHFLHLSGGADILVATLQNDACAFFEYANTQFFMKQIQIHLSDISFFADVWAEKATTSIKKLASLERVNIATLHDALNALKKNNSLVLQERIRNTKYKLKESKKLGVWLEKNFNSYMSDTYARIFFRSGLLASMIPHLDRVKGHVQHDQYHRYSVDAHTLQAVREVLRIKRHPRLLGRLAKVVRKLSEADWNVLLWTALFHDLGKGLKRDHSTEGAELAKRNLISLGLSLKLTTQVVWMVQNHLIMSRAAFRQNPMSQQTWAELFRRGVKGSRIAKLCIFTAIDIRATNPDAWNEWKERLLFNLASALHSPQANAMSGFMDYGLAHKVKINKSFIELLDPSVIHKISNRVLLQDYINLSKAKKNLAPLVFVNKEKEVWIRLHDKVDRPGLFLQFVNKLNFLGLNVQEAFVQTYSEWGAYDWFKIRTNKKTSHTKKLLTSDVEESKSIKSVVFARISLVSENENEAVISFRGKDQRGALLSAAKMLHDLGFELSSAKVHTWGRQIEDVFTVRKSKDFAFQFNKIRKHS